MGKATTPTDRQSRRHNPLQDDILATGPLKNKAPKRKKGKNSDEEDNGEGFVDATRSRTILKLGRELAEEDGSAKPQAAVKPTVDLFGIESRYGTDVGDEQAYDDEEAWGEEDEIVEEIEIDPEDLETYRKFLPEAEDDPAAMLNQHGWGSKGPDDEMAGGGTNLTELILEKIAAHEAAEARKAAGVPVRDEEYELPPKVVEVYTKYVPQIGSRRKFVANRLIGLDSFCRDTRAAPCQNPSKFCQLCLIGRTLLRLRNPKSGRRTLFTKRRGSFLLRSPSSARSSWSLLSSTRSARISTRTRS